MGENNMYCGAGGVPKGKIRGTPEYCIQTNQVRYYGLELIDEDLLKRAKGTTTNLDKELLKLRRMEDDAKVLIKKVNIVKIILEDDRSRPSQLKRAQKKMDALLLRRDKLVKKLKAQKAVVATVEADEKRRAKTKAKTKKSGSKTKKSGSKTKKSGSKSGSKTKKSKSSK